MYELGTLPTTRPLERFVRRPTIFDYLELPKNIFHIRLERPPMARWFQSNHLPVHKPHRTLGTMPLSRLAPFVLDSTAPAPTRLWQPTPWPQRDADKGSLVRLGRARRS